MVIANWVPDDGWDAFANNGSAFLVRYFVCVVGRFKCNINIFLKNRQCMKKIRWNQEETSTLDPKRNWAKVTVEINPLSFNLHPDQASYYGVVEKKSWHRRNYNSLFLKFKPTIFFDEIIELIKIVFVGKTFWRILQLN